MWSTVASPVFIVWCVVMHTGVTMFEEEDEPLVDAALAADVFSFIRNCIVANADFHQEVCWFTAM